MSTAVFEARGGTLPRQKPRPVVRELKGGDVVEGPGFTVRVRAVIHAQPILECFGYRCEADERSFVYSGDAGPCRPMHELAQDCDVLVHMCHFISGTELNEEFAKRNGGHLDVARLGRDANVKNLVASHITEQMDVPGVKERLIREMAEIYRGNLFFAEDLMVVPTDAPTPKKLD